MESPDSKSVDNGKNAKPKARKLLWEKDGFNVLTSTFFVYLRIVVLINAIREDRADRENACAMKDSKETIVERDIEKKLYI